MLNLLNWIFQKITISFYLTPPRTGQKMYARKMDSHEFIKKFDLLNVQFIIDLSKWLYDTF